MNCTSLKKRHRMTRYEPLDRSLTIEPKSLLARWHEPAVGIVGPTSTDSEPPVSNAPVLATANGGDAMNLETETSNADAAGTVVTDATGPPGPVEATETPTAVGQQLVEIHNLTRHFDTTTAVKDVSFSFDKGQIFGFIGPNGAGKSTTMRILSTLDLPSSGSCLVNGINVADEPQQIRQLIGYMPDNYGTYPNMSVQEYLDFFARAHGLRGAGLKQAVAGIVDFCQLDGIRDKLITTLSKGMKQRLCLGRCLIHDPHVLILDEPSAGLDPRARIEFRDLLLALRDQGKAILISSHILAELEEMCDAVAIIELGQLVATGSVVDVKRQVRQAQAQHASAEPNKSQTVIVRLAHEVERFHAILAEQPELSDIRTSGDEASVNISGGPDAQAALLKRLIAADLPISSFAPRDANLEDVFLHLTEGKVQ